VPYLPFLPTLLLTYLTYTDSSAVIRAAVCFVAAANPTTVSFCCYDFATVLQVNVAWRCDVLFIYYAPRLPANVVFLLPFVITLCCYANSVHRRLPVSSLQRLVLSVSLTPYRLRRRVLHSFLFCSPPRCSGLFIATRAVATAFLLNVPTPPLRYSFLPLSNRLWLLTLSFSHVTV